MRQRAAEFGDERHHRLLRQQNDVGRRDVVADDDGRFAARVEFLIGRLVVFQQAAQDAAAHVHHIVFARAQVGIVHLIKHRHQRIAAAGQRGLGVALLLADGGDRGFRDRAVVEHQQVRVDERGDLPRGARGNLRAHRAQLVLGASLRAVEARDLVLDLGGGDRVIRDFQIAAVQPLGAAQGNAARDANAVVRGRHA